MLTKLKALYGNLAVYGIGDVVTTAIGFLLLPVYTRYLSPADYGILALLTILEVVLKIVYRWGVDASYMRLYYDCEDDRGRRVLATTILGFLALANTALIVPLLVWARPLSAVLFGAPQQVPALRLVLVNTFALGFTFVPFNLYRVRGETVRFTVLTVLRSVLTIVLRLVFVVGTGWGVLGIVMADVATTAVVLAALVPAFGRLFAPAFSWPLLREALSFGLPRVPHGFAHQALVLADRYFLRLFSTMRDVGLYSVGYSFSLSLKLFLSAFEYAWAPFYFETMREPDAPRTFARMATYSYAVLILLGTALASLSGDLVRIMTAPAFHAAARVVPLIVVSVVLQGVYLLTSIGLNITKQTRYYPIATGIAAAVNIGANALLIPRFGMMGAAYATVIAYAVLAGVSMYFSQRHYPIPFEWGRLLKLSAAGAAVYAATRLVAVGSPWVGVAARGAILAVFPAALLAMGFFDRRELGRLRRLSRPVLARVGATSGGE